MVALLLLAVMAALLIGAHKKGIKANRSNKVLGGVCSGLSQYFELTPVLVRFLYVVLTLVTGGFAILLYIGLWLTLPKQ